jgi:hypothetical protein
VENCRREFWWLLILEAALFFSLPCWDLTASWAEPVDHPFRFGVAVVAASAAAMFACHLGPAVFAARFGRRQYPFSWVLLVWLGVGYVEWILSSARPAGAIFLVTVVVAAWVKSWWKPAAVAGLLLGAGIVVWAMVTNWNGLWSRNPQYGGPGPLQFDWLIAKGIVLSAAPATVIGWRIGRIEMEPKRIWVSGVAGVFLPLVLSVTMASLAAEAGANLYWVPSLFRGFNWALLGPHGRLEPAVETLTVWTMWWPALLSAVSLRILAPQWTRWGKAWMVPIAIGLIVGAAVSMTWHPEGLFSIAATPAHELWAGSLVILGAFAGVAGLMLRPSR